MGALGQTLYDLGTKISGLLNAKRFNAQKNCYIYCNALTMTKCDKILYVEHGVRTIFNNTNYKEWVMYDRELMDKHVFGGDALTQTILAQEYKVTELRLKWRRKSGYLRAYIKYSCNNIINNKPDIVSALVNSNN